MIQPFVLLFVVILFIAPTSYSNSITYDTIYHFGYICISVKGNITTGPAGGYAFKEHPLYSTLFNIFLRATIYGYIIYHPDRLYYEYNL